MGSYSGQHWRIFLEALEEAKTLSRAELQRRVKELQQRQEAGTKEIETALAGMRACVDELASMSRQGLISKELHEAAEREWQHTLDELDRRQREFQNLVSQSDQVLPEPKQKM
jgi:chromosome segregation ATPase